MITSELAGGRTLSANCPLRVGASATVCAFVNGCDCFTAVAVYSAAGTVAVFEDGKA